LTTLATDWFFNATFITLLDVELLSGNPDGSEPSTTGENTHGGPTKTSSSEKGKFNLLGNRETGMINKYLVSSNYPKQ